MSLLGIPLDKINEADIRSLISIGVGESPYLDYKQKIYGDSGDDRSEFLADILSFANTLGGDLVIGVVESGGLPTILTPVQGDCDQEIRRLEQIALSGLEPRIRNLGIRAIPVSAGGHVIIVRVPRSFNPPHRVIVRNTTVSGRAPAQQSISQMSSSSGICSLMPPTLQNVSGFSDGSSCQDHGGRRPGSASLSWKSCCACRAAAFVRRRSPR